MRFVRSGYDSLWSKRDEWGKRDGKRKEEERSISVSNLR